MQEQLEKAIVLLSRSPGAFDALLRGLPDFWTRSNEGGNSWSAYDIMGHLAHADRTNWIPRVKSILRHGDTQAFESFDRLGQVQASAGKSLGELLDDFAEARTVAIAELRALNLTEEKLAMRGLHPALGAVTISELLATWAAHDLTHLHQLSRVMAHQYRDAVGPMQAFLGVMHCRKSQG